MALSWLVFWLEGLIHIFVLQGTVSPLYIRCSHFEVIMFSSEGDHTMVGNATSVLVQVVLDKTCGTLKKVFWTFSRLQLSCIKIKKMSPCALESKFGPDGLPNRLNGGGIYHNRVA